MLLTELPGFGLSPSSGILENRKHDVSETESQVKAEEDAYSVRSLRKSESQSLDQFPKCRYFYSLEYRMMEKIQKPSNSALYTIFRTL
jgi:hypothetical protein